MKNLQNYRVQEISAEETQNIDGGVVGLIAVAAVLTTTYYIGYAIGYYTNH